MLEQTQGAIAATMTVSAAILAFGLVAWGTACGCRRRWLRDGVVVAAALPAGVGLWFGIAEYWWLTRPRIDVEATTVKPMVDGLLLSVVLLALLLLVWTVEGWLAKPRATGWTHWLLFVPAPPLVALAGRLACGCELVLGRDVPWLVVLCCGSLGAALWHRRLLAPPAEDDAGIRGRSGRGVLVLLLAAVLFGGAAYHSTPVRFEQGSSLEGALAYGPWGAELRLIDVLAAALATIPLWPIAFPRSARRSWQGRSWWRLAVLVGAMGLFGGALVVYEVGVARAYRQYTGCVADHQPDGIELPVAPGLIHLTLPVLFVHADGTAEYDLDGLPWNLAPLDGQACEAICGQHSCWHLPASVDRRVPTSVLAHAVRPCMNLRGLGLEVGLAPTRETPRLGVYTRRYAPRVDGYGIHFASPQVTAHLRAPNDPEVFNPWARSPAIDAYTFWNLAPDAVVVARLGTDSISFAFRPGTSAPIAAPRDEPHAAYDAINELNVCRTTTIRILLEASDGLSFGQLVNEVQLMTRRRYAFSPDPVIYEFWLTDDRAYVDEAFAQSTGARPVCPVEPWRG